METVVKQQARFYTLRFHILFAMAFVGTVRGQLPAALPTFEVATVKLSSPEERAIGMLCYPGGRIVITNYTLRMLIHDAYQVQDFQIIGGPKWASEERYSITATPPPGSKSSKVNPNNPKLPPPEEEILMLRALLAVRFSLAVHEEEKETQVLALTAPGQGHKMKPPKDPDTFPVVVYGRTGNAERPDFLRAENATMAIITKRFSDMLKRPVVDRTNIKGSFDFYFEYVQGLSDAAEGPSLTSAVQGIGLKLVTAKALVRHVVIDSAEKPTGN